MKRNSLPALLTLLTFAFIVTGCGNSGAFLATHATQVQLGEGNYQIVAQNVTGSAQNAAILGLSHSWGLTTQSYGLIPLKGSKMMYKDAREALWTSFEELYGSAGGRKLALVNVQYDAATTNYIFYTQAKITITADVIEFD
jgi:hypothetical protein